MYVVFVVIVAVVVFGIVAIVMGRGDLMDDEPSAVPMPELGEQAVTDADLRGLTFSVAVRGYRMDQVDHVIDRLGQELTRRDERIAELERALGQPADPAVYRRPPRDAAE